MSVDTETAAIPDDVADRLRQGAAEIIDRGRRAEARHNAEITLRAIRDRLSGADDRFDGLLSRLRSNEPGELSGADVDLLADALEAESMHLTLAVLKELDPFPASGAAMLSIPADQMPAFTIHDVPRLQKLREGVSKK